MSRETKRQRIVRLIEEAIRRNDHDGIYWTLIQTLECLDDERMLEVVRLIVREAPDPVVRTMNERATSLLAETYAEMDAAEAAVARRAS